MSRSRAVTGDCASPDHVMLKMIIIRNGMKGIKRRRGKMAEREREWEWEWKIKERDREGEGKGRRGRGEGGREGEEEGGGGGGKREEERGMEEEGRKEMVERGQGRKRGGRTRRT